MSVDAMASVAAALNASPQADAPSTSSPLMSFKPLDIWAGTPGYFDRRLEAFVADLRQSVSGYGDGIHLEEYGPWVGLCEWNPAIGLQIVILAEVVRSISANTRVTTDAMVDALVHSRPLVYISMVHKDIITKWKVKSRSVPEIAKGALNRKEALRHQRDAMDLARAYDAISIIALELDDAVDRFNKQGLGVPPDVPMDHIMADARVYCRFLEKELLESKDILLEHFYVLEEQLARDEQRNTAEDAQLGATSELRRRHLAPAESRLSVSEDTRDAHTASSVESHVRKRPLLAFQALPAWFSSQNRLKSRNIELPLVPSVIRKLQRISWPEQQGLLLGAFLVVTISGVFTGISLSQSRDAACVPNQSKHDDGFWTLLSQALLQAMAITCTLIPLVRDKAVALHSGWFGLSVGTSVLAAVMAPMLYGVSWQASSAATYVSGLAGLMASVQLVGGIQKRQKDEEFGGGR